jgi:trehalose-phosphatase
VIFIDHEAIPSVEYAAESMKPTREALDDLEEISLDKRNTLIIFSNQSKEVVKEYFEEHLDNVWLVAESGYVFKTGDGSDWKKLISLGNKVWINTILEVMQIYTDNIDGAIIEERESTLVWNYKNASEEHGNMAAKELYAQIKTILGNIPVEIIQGKGYIEVKPVKLKKVRIIVLIV